MHLTERMILARSKQSDLSAIKRINLWGCELTDISIISTMKNIEVLALSVNSLTNLKPLESCTKLQELYLRKNNIEDFNQLIYLQKLSQLSHLWLAENPCCAMAGANYRARVVKMLPHLTKLDEDFITAEDIELAKQLDCPQKKSIEVCGEKEKLLKNCNSPCERQQNMGTLINQDNADLSQRSHSNCEIQEQKSPNSGQQSRSSPSPNATHQNSPSVTKEGRVRESGEFENNFNSSDHSNCSNLDEKVEIFPTNFSLPISLFSSLSDEQSSYIEVQPSNGVYSQNSIPQLNLIVEIQQCSTTDLEIPLNLSDSNSMLAIDDCPITDNEEGAKEGKDGFEDCNNYENCGSQTAHTNRDAVWNEEYHTAHSRSRSPWEHRRFSDCMLNSRPNTVGQSQENQHILGLEGITQTPRSRYFSKACRPRWDDARSSATLTTVPSTRRRNANVLSALLCIVPELDAESLQVLDHNIQCRMEELSMN